MNISSSGCCVSFRALLTCFTTAEVMNWSQIKVLYQEELQHGSKNSPPTGVFDPQTQTGQKCWEDLCKRVVEHVRHLCSMLSIKIASK